MILKDMDWLMEVMAEGIRNAPNVNSSTQARAVLDALEVEGVVLVPMEATEEMRSMGRIAIPGKTIEDTDHRAGVCLRAGNSASPYRRKDHEPKTSRDENPS